MAVKHVCNKEQDITKISVELSMVKNDIEWTKTNIENISGKIDKILDSVNNLNMQLTKINNDIYGNNNDDGIKNNVNKHNTYIIDQQGLTKAVIWFLGITQPVISGLLIWILTK